MERISVGIALVCFGSASVAAAQNTAPDSPPEFIAPVYTMDDVKGEVTYVDRERNFFLIIEGGKFYIGHPIGSPQRAGSDVPYTWGEVVDCSTSQLSCVQLGNQIYIRPKEMTQVTAHVDRTVVSAWARGMEKWVGTGVRCATSAPNDECRPLMTYLYNVDEDEAVSHIIITYWNRDLELKTYDLVLESGSGISL